MLVAGEEHHAGEELREDAARRPDVHLRAVLRRAEKQLGRTVPERDHARGVVDDHRVVDEARQPEVRQLQVAGAGDEDVGRLEVAVNDVVGVQIIQHRKQLEHDPLHRADRRPGRETDPGGLEESEKVVLHVLHHEGDRAERADIIFGGDFERSRVERSYFAEILYPGF